MKVNEVQNMVFNFKIVKNSKNDINVVQSDKISRTWANEMK